jgi:hypothetical protein
LIPHRAGYLRLVSCCMNTLGRINRGHDSLTHAWFRRVGLAQGFSCGVGKVLESKGFWHVWAMQYSSAMNVPRRLSQSL